MTRLKTLLLASLVGLVSILPFLRSLDQGVVSIDDYTYVVEHKEINGGFPSADFRWMVTNTDHAIFMPLTWLSYLTDCEIARHLEPAGASLDEREAVRFRVMHLHGVLLHGVNAALVFVFFLLLASALPHSKGGVLAVLVAALFWGLHPLRTESVVWIASRKDLVSFFFLALALILWTRWRLRSAEPPRYTSCYWLSLACVVLGALGKPSVMIFPGLVMVVDVFVLRKIEIRRDGRWNTSAFLTYLLPLLIGFAVGVEATMFQDAGGAMSNPVPNWYRLLNAPVSYGVYLKNVVWPFDLALQCTLRHPHPPAFLVPGLLVFGWFMWYFLKKVRALKAADFAVGETDLTFAGLLWFFGAFVPFIGVVGFGYHAYADRFTYIPSLGLLLVLLGLLRGASGLVRSLSLAAVFALVPLSVRQVGFWKDEETVWKRTLAVDGDRNFVANLCLAMYEFDVPHDIPRALQHFNRAYEVCPLYVLQFGLVYMNVLSEAGENDRAYAFFKDFREYNTAHMAAVETDAPEGAVVWGPDYASARVAMQLAETNFLKSAEQELDRLLKVSPKSQHPLYLKGRLAEIRGDHAAALRFWQEVVDRTEPSDVFIRYRFLKDILKKEGASNGMEQAK